MQVTNTSALLLKFNFLVLNVPSHAVSFYMNRILYIKGVANQILKTAVYNFLTLVSSSVDFFQRP